MSSLTLAVDFSASMTKCFFTQEVFQPELILMEPEVVGVSLQSLEAYEQSKIGDTSPENAAWVEHKGKHYAVGYLARHKFSADLQLKKRKFESAIPKVLAMVGAISSKYELSNETKIQLAVLLPWGEYQDRLLFKKVITEALSNYKFRGQAKSFILDSFLCMPEGGGVLIKGREPGASLQGLKIVVVIVGYRDVSLLFMDRGELSTGMTRSLGYYQMLDAIKARTSGLNEHALVKAVCKAGKNINPKALMELVNTVDEDYRANEISQIRTAIAEARVEYWSKLEPWLKLEVGRDVDEVLLTGGTALFLRPELNNLFSYTNVNWCENLERQIISNFQPIVAAKSLSMRLTDIYGLFFYLMGNTSKQRIKTDA
ncbi:MAG: ParM/StbA family protein [Nostocaceae cyanobacterium]|nr:ParM/StbA family protein [Nostocaceae cyanobacterium]